MAQANIYVTCETCGKEFRHTKIRANRKAADSYEEWAKENITVCPTCYKEACRKFEEKKRRNALTANIMRRAWKIAREGQAKFGGKAKEYFAVSLRMAWAETRKIYTAETNGTEKVLEIIKYGENGVKLVEAQPCEETVTGGGKFSMPQVKRTYKSSNPLLVVDGYECKVTTKSKDTYLECLCGATFVCGETYAAKDTLKYTGFKWDKFFKAWVSTEKELSTKDNALLAPAKKPCKVSKDDEDYCALTGEHELGDFKPMPKIVLVR